MIFTLALHGYFVHKEIFFSKIIGKFVALLKFLYKWSQLRLAAVIVIY